MTRQFPDADPRVETGCIKFGYDWTGLFIRGDNAFNFALRLKNVLDKIERGGFHEIHPLEIVTLRGLQGHLDSTNENRERP